MSTRTDQVEGPVTRIGTSPFDVDRLRLRGRDVLTEVLDQVTFSEAFYLAVTGRIPDGVQRRVLDAALVILMDHGLTPTALVSRLVGDSVADQPQVAVAAGLMMVGDKYAGTMVGVGTFLNAGINVPNHTAWAQDLVKQYRSTGRRLPGFGHPFYRGTDPRADKILQIAMEAGVQGKYINLLRIVQTELSSSLSQPAILNVTGALGAVLCEIDFPVRAMRGLAVVSRAAGLAAHVAEEATHPIAPALIKFAATVPYHEDDGNGINS